MDEEDDVADETPIAHLEESAAAWKEIDLGVDEIEFAMTEGIQALRESLDSSMGMLCRYEVERAVRWVKRGGTPDEIVAGILSMEEPGEPKPNRKQRKRAHRPPDPELE